MKELLVFQGPVSSRSGYGDHCRDLVRSLIEINRFDIKIFDMPWGSCPRDVLKEGRDNDIISLLLKSNSLDKQPDVFVQCSVPNEFNPIGKFNIGITAGIETTHCSHHWVEGLNKMDLNIVPSKHSKDTLIASTYDRKDQRTHQTISQLKVEKPIEILFEGVDLKVFNTKNKVPKDLSDELLQIKEKFCFLICAHWLQGDDGHDRKDLSTAIKVFCETFEKNPSHTKPALILKTSQATFSVIDREEILGKISHAVKLSGIKNPPNIYLLHGDLTPEEMNGLYNHPKVKAMVSFTKGEGYGRPLAEFSTTGKPILVSNWSGHLDFCKHVIKLPGQLMDVHPSAVWENVILPNSKWFYVTPSYAGRCMKEVFKNYKNFLKESKKQRVHVNKNYNMDAMTDEFKTILEKHVPVKKDIVIPKLNLPKLQTT